jgi:AraC-like DNA-binding protein
MGKGGIAFLAFGAYAGAVLIYLIIFFIKKLREEQNQLIRLKLKYIIASFLISGILSIMNYPAIVGLDFYPPGNFSFIPLSFLAYGVLRYRLLDFQGIFQIATLWAFLSTLLTVPNIAALYLLYPYIGGQNYAVLFIAGLIWFFIDYYYFRLVHNLVEKFFNKQKLELMQVESDFLGSIYSLKTFNEVASQFTGVIKKTLSFETAELILCDAESDTIPGFGGSGFSLSPGLKKKIIKTNTILERDALEYTQNFKKERAELLNLFENYKSKYIVPLIQHNILIALLLLPEKKNGKPLTPDEILFIKNVKSSAAISLANSIMYSDLAELKESLDLKVREKTSDLEKSMEALQGVVDNLEKEVQDKVISYFTKKKIEEAISYIEKNYNDEITRESLAKIMNMNSDYLGRMFKKLTGKNISDYINECRLKKACELLINSDENIVDIAFAVGFESLPTFYRVFKKIMDETPINYRTKYQQNPS